MIGRPWYPQLVELTATNHAKIYGLYPRNRSGGRVVAENGRLVGAMGLGRVLERDILPYAS